MLIETKASPCQLFITSATEEETPRQVHITPHDAVTKTVSKSTSCFSDTVCLCSTGVALKHTYEKAFSIENGMRRNVPRVVVAITDGRSQDEVKKNAAKLQHAGNKNQTC